ncbi:MAG: sulfur oxidation c-type cytochrome SoxA [Rhizobiales bacterium]|jgi:sulfur-oxidizing protein SoxA|nr:sulfur oxidation c-type cytochrome SoxA [Hyphomicrobiales bacterium]
MKSAAPVGALALIAALGAFAALAQIAEADRKSGSAFMSAETQQMQRDDGTNPGMLSALDGESLWKTKTGGAAKSCADCHGEAQTSMKGVAARYPAFNEASQTPIDLQGRINQCRQDQQKDTPLAPESRDLLALSAFIGLQSRGMPTAPPDDQRLTPFRERGRALWSQRMGQLNFSCAQCHEDNWGKHLGSAPIPQAHANAYPIYRLEWQGMGSLQRRLRNCMSGMRALAFPYGAQEFIELELYLAQRARGMPVETPGVRP